MGQFLLFFFKMECVNYSKTFIVDIYTVAMSELVLLHIQDTKTFPKCYVGRNGKQNQQKLHIQVCGSLKTQRNQGCHD